MVTKHWFNLYLLTLIKFTNVFYEVILSVMFFHFSFSSIYIYINIYSK